MPVKVKKVFENKVMPVVKEVMVKIEKAKPKVEKAVQDGKRRIGDLVVR